MHAGYVAELARGDFQEGFDAGAGRGFQSRLGLDGRGNAQGEGLAGGEGHIEAAGEEAFEHLEIAARQPGYALVGEREAGGRLGGGGGGGEDVGGGGAGGLGAPRGFFNAVAHDECTGGKVAETLMIAGGEDGDGTDGVEERDLVDVADEVAGHGFKESDGAAGALDDADAGDALAGGAAVIESLREGEVAPVEEKKQEEIEGSGPLRGEAIERGEAGQEVGKDPHDEADADAPDHIVDEEGDETAANAGQGHLNGDEFRGIDAKLI